MKERDRTIADMRARGMTIQAIADACGIPRSTVHTICQRLGSAGKAPAGGRGWRAGAPAPSTDPRIQNIGGDLGDALDRLRGLDAGELADVLTAAAAALRGES